jgi:hypothetical protein
MAASPSNSYQPPAEAGIPYSTREWITPTFLHALRIWWAYYWPTFIVSMALTFLGAMGVAILSRTQAIAPVASIWFLRLLPYFATAAVGLFVFQYLLTTPFGKFRIAIFPAGYGENERSIPPTFAHGARIWWACTWRSILYGVVAAFVMAIPAGTVVAMFTFSRVRRQLRKRWSAL